MVFVSVRELFSRSAAVWRSLAQEKDPVVTSLRQARAQLAVAAMQQRARETGADRLTLDDVNAEIDAVRRSRDE